MFWHCLVKHSPLNVYNELIRMHKEEQLSFKNVVVFLEYEFYPLSASDAGVLGKVKEDFLNHVDICPENIYAPDGMMPKDAIFDFCNQYEEHIQQLGGIDCMLLGIGQYSNIMFNGAGTTPSSRIRLVLLEVLPVKRLHAVSLLQKLFLQVLLQWVYQT